MVHPGDFPKIWHNFIFQHFLEFHTPENVIFMVIGYNLIQIYYIVLKKMFKKSLFIFCLPVFIYLFI